MLTEAVETFYQLDGLSLDPVTSPVPRPGDYQSAYSFEDVSILSLLLSGDSSTEPAAEMVGQLRSHSGLHLLQRDPKILLEWYGILLTTRGCLMKMVFRDWLFREWQGGSGHQSMAVNTAVASLDALDNVNLDLVRRREKPIRFGIGVCTGNVCLHSMSNGREEWQWVTGSIDDEAFKLAQQALQLVEGQTEPLKLGHVLLNPRSYKGLYNKSLRDGRVKEAISLNSAADNLLLTSI